MHASFRVALGLTLALTLPALIACSNGIKVGDWQVIDPDPPIDVSSIEITRTLPADDNAKAGSQKLTIDTLNGRASLTDSDGSVHPLQLPADRVEKIRDFAATRGWLDADIESPKKHTAPLTHYALTIFENGKPLKKGAAWPVPSRKPLPEGFTNIVEAFDQADRTVHPLSNNINLLK